MPNGLKNWGYKDLKKFLKKHKFSFYEEREGSHEAWINETTGTIVNVNVLNGHKSYPIRTLETMVRQSKIEKKEWTS